MIIEYPTSPMRPVSHHPQHGHRILSKWRNSAPCQLQHRQLSICLCRILARLSWNWCLLVCTQVEIRVRHVCSELSSVGAQENYLHSVHKLSVMIGYQSQRPYFFVVECYATYEFIASTGIRERGLERSGLCLFCQSVLGSFVCIFFRFRPCLVFTEKRDAL